MNDCDPLGHEERKVTESQSGHSPVCDNNVNTTPSSLAPVEHVQTSFDSFRRLNEPHSQRVRSIKTQCFHLVHKEMYSPQNVHSGCLSSVRGLCLSVGYLWVLPCHVTICIQKDGHRPGWICWYFRGSRRAGKFKPGISRPGGKYRKLTTAANSCTTAAVMVHGRTTFLHSLLGCTAGIPVSASGLDRDPAVHPASECRKLYLFTNHGH